MSGIAAIVRFDGGPVEPGILEAMTAAMDYRGPDGITHRTGESAGFGHLMLHTTPESLEEVQPLANDDASLVLVMDGYLHNWSELRSTLLASGAALRSRSDAELVLRAWEAWGADCPLRLEGEFAFILWDSRERAAWLVSDHALLRPLHYAWDGRRLTVATDIAGVLADPAVPRELNLPVLAEHCANQWIIEDQTPWQAVHRLPPATAIRFDARGMTRAEYWKPPLEVTLRYGSDEEYAEHYTQVLFEAVRRSSRSHRPLACEVSGGLDSSAIFAVADKLLGAERLGAPELLGYTLHSDTGAITDDFPYARDCAAKVGRPVREFECWRPELAWFRERIRADLDVSPSPNLAMSMGLQQTAVADGCRVLLNGEGGDEFLTGRPLHFIEDLRDRNWPALRRSLAASNRDFGQVATARDFLRYAVLPQFPRWLRDLWYANRWQKGPGEHASAFWLSAALDADLRERRRTAERESILAIANHPRRGMFMTLKSAYSRFSRSICNRHYSRLGFEARSPLYARPLIEFNFSTPEHTRMRGKIRKYTHRLAMSNLLPNSILQRSDKADFVHYFEKPIEKTREYYPRVGDDDRNVIFDDGGMDRLFEIFHQVDRDLKPWWELWGCFSSLSLLNIRTNPESY